MKLKYVVTSSGDFAIFTALTNHSEIGSRLHGLPVGAGFIHLNDHDNLFVCYGESISMNLKSRGEEDANIINKKLGL